MALRHVTITFYSIEECGYYRRGDRSPVFGGMVSTLQDLKRWSHGKPVSLTKLWELSEDNDDQLPVYLFDLRQAESDWLVATWNEVSATEQSVLSIAEESVVGAETETHANRIEDRTIPGYPTYFWFLPDRGVMATVKFEGALAGKDAMAKYVLHFLRQESSYVVQDADGNIQGYEAAEPISGRAYPRFKVSPYAKMGEVDLILRSREKIRKIVRSGTLRPSNHVDVPAWAGFLAFFRGAERSRRMTGEHKVKIELEYTPTAEELDRMVQVELSLDRNREWGGLGVVLQGEGGRIRWVSHSLARDTFEFDVRLNRSGVVLADSLMESLQANKQVIMRILE